MPFVAVHDSYWTHACFVNKMNQVCESVCSMKVCEVCVCHSSVGNNLWLFIISLFWRIWLITGRVNTEVFCKCLTWSVNSVLEIQCVVVWCC